MPTFSSRSKICGDNDGLLPIMGTMLIDSHPPAIITSDSPTRIRSAAIANRSEEHTSELQSHSELVCRLPLEKKKTPSSSQPSITNLKRHVVAELCPKAN